MVNNRKSSQGSLTGKKGSWIVTLIAIVLALMFSPEIFDFDYSQGTLSQEETRSLIEGFNGSNFDILPQQKKIPVNYLSANDGDTIRIDINGHTVPVRYLIINSPEMNYNEGSPDPYALEAKEANEAYLESADQVYIELDVGPATDNYDRILAYVYADDILINEALLEEGFASVRYINPPNNSYEALLRQAENRAREDGLNIWN